MTTAYGPHDQDGTGADRGYGAGQGDGEHGERDQPGYGDQPGYSRGYGNQPGYSRGYGDQPGDSSAYGDQPVYGDQPGNGPAYGDQPGYGTPPPGYDPSYPGYDRTYPGYAGQPGYGSVPPPPPPPMWTGDAPGPGGSGPDGPDGRRRTRRRLTMMTAGVAAVALAAGGAAWATGGSGVQELSTTSIVRQTDPGVVDVTSTIGYQHATAEGTGMVLTSNGIVLTNNHVVAGSTSVKVRDIGNGRTYTAKVLGYSDSNDVAVLKLVGASGLATVSIGDSSSVSVGQKVVALGNAGGRGGTPSVATGKVTGTGDSITAEDQGDGTVEHLSDMIRTNANIEPGDSGGPLLNSSGQVIGMDTAASSSGSNGYGTTAQQSTVAFSIPINHALSIAHQIESGTSSATVHIGATGFLGVEVSSGSGGNGQSGSGVAISGVVPGTPAANAGLGAGDTIIAVGGHALSSNSDLQKVIQQYHPGDKLSIRWADQSGQTHTSTITLMTGPTG